MFHKLVRTLAIAVAAVGLTASLALAETEWVSGKVMSIDTQGTITITTDENEIKSLPVPKEMLKGVKAGHDVELEVVDGKVKNVTNYSSDS